MAGTDGYPVKLYVYDLTKGLARTMSMPFLGKQIDGVWHTGVVVYGEEYYFGGTGGIERCPPCGTILGQPDRIVDMGNTQVPKEMFIEYLSQLATSSFRAENYNLFEHNCNNFSDEIAQFLTGSKIPSHITSLPAEILNTPLGAMIKPLIDSMNVQPSGGHAVFNTSPSNPQPSQPGPHPSQPPPSQTNKLPSTSSDVIQKPITFKAELDNSHMKGSEIQGNIQSTFSTVELNLWNETLEYLQMSKPSWSLGKNHLHMIGKILCTKPTNIKSVLWTATCLMLENLILVEDFLPVVVHSSDNTLGQILSDYENLTMDQKQHVIKVIINLCSSKMGCDILFGNKKDTILSEHCIQICCDGLLDQSNISDEFLLLGSALSLNISLAQTDDDTEVEVGSAIQSKLQQQQQQLNNNTAIYLLSALINIINKNNQMKCLVAVMGCDWPDLDRLSDKAKILNSSIKTMCSA